MDENRQYGLLVSDIENVLRILQENRNISKAVLFGSRAIGTQKVGSDIDIAINGVNLTLDDVLEVSIEIEELSLPYKFDLVIYDRIKEKALVEHINRVGIVLFDEETIDL